MKYRVIPDIGGSTTFKRKLRYGIYFVKILTYTRFG